jgi:methyl-accepting chemotaxis protein
MGTADWLSQRAVSLSEKIQNQLEKVDEQLDQFESKAKLLDELGSRVSEIEQKRRDIADTLARVSVQANETIEISRQIADLTRQVRDLSARQLPSLAPESTDARAALDRLASAAQSTHDKIVDSTRSTTVWLQFSGAPQERVQEFSQALQNQAYIVPTAERISSALNKREVRYFFQEDAEIAQKLASDVNQILESSAINPNLP